MTRVKEKYGYYVLVLIMAVGIILCLVQASGAAVSPDKLKLPGENMIQIITLNDGSKLTGKITAVGENDITFASNVGEVTIAINKIDNIQEVSTTTMRDGKYWFPNPNNTRLYFSPTGRMQKAGTGYFSDILLFFPSISYGVTDNFSIGGGISLFPGVDFDKQLYYIFPKVGFQPSERVYLAGSMIILRIPQFDEDLVEEPKVAGIMFASGTFGTDIANLTLGLGYGYVDDDIADKPAVLVGGEWRVARRMSLVTENWVFPDIDEPLVSYGVRFFGENLSTDLALFTPLGEDAFFPGLPFVGFTYNF